jgi:NAD(P)-dependent dehydrogenase (short-subunit alcohol dehydrogenase family)
MSTEQSGPTAQAPATGETPVTGRFDRQVALVTGSSDRGIGGAIAERLAREGAAVSLVSRSEPKRLLKRLQRLGRGVAWAQCDVTEPSDVTRVVDDCQDKFGKLDILVNNAGVEFAQPFDAMADQQWLDLLDVNLHGAVRVSRAALPRLLESRGVIVNVASALALGGCAGFSIYSASKAALIGLTQSLAWELAPRGVRVVGVAPGMVHTPMIHKHIDHLSKEVWEKIEACHPLGMGMPHDVAAAVAFLASEDARWITGVTLPLGWAPSYALPVEQFMK